MESHYTNKEHAADIRPLFSKFKPQQVSKNILFYLLFLFIIIFYFTYSN